MNSHQIFRLNMILEIFLFLIALSNSLPQKQSYEIYYQWKEIDYSFQNESIRSELLKNGGFIPKNNMMTIGKIWKDRMFVTTPRYKPGVPACLCVLPYSSDPKQLPQGQAKTPHFQPFPSWEMQELGNCNSFQFIISMEIDPWGRLWMLDVGQTNLFTTPKVLCPPRLFIMDVEAGDKIIHVYNFPAHVVSARAGYLKDIKVACRDKDNCFAYISNIFENKLVIYDRNKNESWSVHHYTMNAEEDKGNFTIGGHEYFSGFGIAGMALSPKMDNFATLHYTALASTTVYAVSTSLLNNLRTNTNLTDDQVRVLGEKVGQSDGMTMDSAGYMYYGSLTTDSVYKTKIWVNQTELSVQEKVIQDSIDLSYPDVFAFDNEDSLLVSSEKLQFFRNTEYDWNIYNFRVIRFRTYTRSYNRD